VDAKFVAGVREGVLRKKFEHVREEITEAGVNCAKTNLVVCPPASNMIVCWQQVK